MNKILIGFNIVLAAAVIYLFVKKPAAPETPATPAINPAKTVTGNTPTNKIFSAAKGDGQLRIAFINSDTLSGKYELFKQAEKELTALSEKINKELQSKEASLMATSQRLQKDFELKTKSEQEAAYRQLQNLEMNYGKFKEEKMGELDRLRNENLVKAEGELKAFLEKYCEQNKIDYVLRDGITGSLFYGNKTFDITNDVASGLNAQYTGNTPK